MMDMYMARQIGSRLQQEKENQTIVGLLRLVTLTYPEEAGCPNDKAVVNIGGCDVVEAVMLLAGVKTE